MKNKYKKLLKNTSIFAFGTFGSKILTFLIIPLYTYILSTSDYGKIDLITSTISLLIPFSTFLIYEAAIRFLVGKEFDKKVIFNNCFIMFVVGTLLSVALSPLLLMFLNIQQFYLSFTLLLILSSFSTIFGQFLRANGDNWGFSISGIITSLSLVIFNLIFLLLFKMGMDGYILSLILSQLTTCIFIFIRSHFIKYLCLKLVNSTSLKKMLLYSIPLVPNNIMWWIMNAGDKYVINAFLGDSSNGIFSIAYKIPTIITMFFSIFMQAWQVSAIEEKNDKSRNEFYKTIFKYISLLLFICSTLIILFVHPLFNTVIGTEFKDAWEFVPMLCLATMFNCFSTFAGVVYIVNKDSKGSFFTTFIGACLNLLFNFILIRECGLFGVAIGTIVGYLVVMLIRFRRFDKEFNTSLIDRRFIILSLLSVANVLFYTFIDGVYKYIFTSVCLIIIILICKDDLFAIIKKNNKKITNKNIN